MDPIFGGMFLSGRKAADLLLELLERHPGDLINKMEMVRVWRIN
jgi:hypothetical protein